jgi:hypothetical protein
LAGGDHALLQPILVPRSNRKGTALAVKVVPQVEHQGVEGELLKT